MTDHTPERSLPADFNISIRGWSGDEADARRFGERLMAFTQMISETMDLSPLAKVVVAHDYHAALAEERSDGDANAATANEFGEGAAMALTVREGDLLRKVIVVWTPLIERAFDPDDPQQSAAIQTVMHELVHVDDHAHIRQNLPGGRGCDSGR